MYNCSYVRYNDHVRSAYIAKHAGKTLSETWSRQASWQEGRERLQASKPTEEICPVDKITTSRVCI